MKRIVILLMILMSISQYSFSQLTVGATVRPRAEFRNGFKTLPQENSEPAFFIEQRTRLTALYNASKYRVGLSLQDVRIWGQTGQINKTDALTSLHEGWAQYFITPELSFRAGRQEFKYDNARILGNLNWAQQARSHDALRVQYDDSTWQIHAAAAYNQDDSPWEAGRLFGRYYDAPLYVVDPAYQTAIPNYKHLHFVWFHKDLGSSWFSLYGINNGYQMADTTVNFTQTAGIQGRVGITDKLAFDGEFYYQTGQNVADQNVNAFLANADIHYQISDQLGINPGVDIVSGTGPDAAAGESHTFDPLHGTHHAFYGFMDYFYVGNPHMNKGLQDFYLKTGWKPSSNINLNLHVHQFLSYAEVENNLNEEASKNLGTEIDFFISAVPSENFKVMAGYSHMFATETMELIKGGNSDELTNWAWLMLIFTPVFTDI